jgi:hypothetical protein
MVSPDENLEFVNKATAKCVNTSSGDVEEIQRLMGISSAVSTHTRKVRQNYLQVRFVSISLSNYEQIAMTDANQQEKKVPDRWGLVEKLMWRITALEYWVGGEELTHPSSKAPLNKELLDIESQGRIRHR